METSYQIVRWVFRRYTQLRQAICTSTLLRDPPSEFPLTSINSSVDHNLSGPSRMTNRFHKKGSFCKMFHFHFAVIFTNISTRNHARLLGSCFKTSEKLIFFNITIFRNPLEGSIELLVFASTFCEYNFRHYFNFIHKYFSPFPHGTCSLSVSYFIFSVWSYLPPLFALHYQAILILYKDQFKKII